MRKFSRCLPLALFFAIVSCADRSEGIDRLSFETTSRIATENRIALVIDPYISLRDKSGPEGITVAHGRRGEIYDIKGVNLSQTADGMEIWYDLGAGWVLSSSIRVFSDRSRAESAAKELF